MLTNNSLKPTQTALLILRTLTTAGFLIVLSCTTTIGQGNTIDSLRIVLSSTHDDTTRVDVLHSITGRLIRSNPDSALIHARASFALTENLGDEDRHSRSYRRMAHSLYVTNNLDEFKELLLSYVDYATEIKDYFQVAASYRNLSKIGEATKQPDSSLVYLDKCLQVLEEHPDSIIMIDVYLSKGLTYKYKGFYELSIEALLDGMRISEALPKPYKLGYLHMNIAITYDVMGRHEAAVDHVKKSIQYFEEDNNQRGVTRSLSNLGFGYMKLDSISQAEQSFLKAIDASGPTKMPNIEMHSLVGLADIAFEKENYKECEAYINRAEKIATVINNEYTLAALARFRSKLSLEQNDTATARRYLKDAEKQLTAYREPNEEGSTYFEMADLYEKLGYFEESNDYLKKGHALEDSVYTLKKEQQFAELNLLYETEKKNAEIQLLNKEAELDATKKQGLWIGLGLLVLLAGSIISALLQRRKKERQISAHEKAIEIEKRKNAEHELEFKKKELTTKALQLASKNEFLGSLEEEINNLKSSVDSTVSKTSQRISRLIHNDKLDDEEWQKFGKEFTSVHKDFLDRLKTQHGEFSKNEMRLIALLKMNLSSKDIANTLRISNDGVKKARYRLRKKMNLESSVDIQNYLISF